MIQQIVRSRKLTLLFIEHDMNIVFGISEKVRVMHVGSIIAEGSPQEIRANDQVQKIYLAEELTRRVQDYVTGIGEESIMNCWK